MRTGDVLVALGWHYPTTLEELGELLQYLDPARRCRSPTSASNLRPSFATTRC